MENLVNDNLVLLTERLQTILPILTRLQQRKIITHHESDDITKRSTDLEKNLQLTRILRTKDDRVIPIFLDILRDTGNDHIANKLEESVSSKIEVQFTSIISNFGSQSQHQLSSSISPLVGNDTFQNKASSLGKWWPEKKVLITSFCERKIGDQLMVEKLHFLLQESENKTTVITQDTLVVSGLGGVGKTSIAKSFANHYEDEYGTIIWIDCGEGSLINSFRSLSRDLNVAISKESTLEELARKCFLNMGETNKCLIIYDNAECFVGPEGIRDVLPKNKNFHALITSRNQDWGTENGYGKINKFCMDVFSEHESVEFMKNSLNASLIFNYFQLQTIGKLLGHLPLALQIAVATLNNERITVTDYIELLAMDESDIINENFDDYEHTMNKTMKISLDQIKNHDNGEIAYEILLAFGYLQPDDVDLAFFQRMYNTFEPEIGIPSRLMHQCCKLLEKYSMVTSVARLKSYDLDTGLIPSFVKQDKLYSLYLSIHRLLQQVIRHNAKDKENDILRKILNCNGAINLKLIPYSYAENYTDLKEEFAYIGNQILDGISLAELLKEGRFNEAVKLALMTLKRSYTIGLTNQYFKSMYNYAVCLIKNGQVKHSVQILESLSQELIKFHSSKRQLLEVFKINYHDEIELQLLGTDEAAPNMSTVKVLINFLHGRIDSNILLTYFYDVNEIVTLLHLNLILFIGNSKRNGLSEVEEFLDAIFKYRFLNSFLQFAVWFKLLKMVTKVTLKLASNSETHNIIAKLYFMVRRFMFSIQNQEFLSNAGKCKEIEKEIRSHLEGEEKLPALFVGDIFSIINTELEPHNVEKLETPANDGTYTCTTIMPFKEILPSSTSSKFGDGKLTCNGAFFVFSSDPALINNLSLNEITINATDLSYFISSCTNLAILVLNDIYIWGSSRLKLPKLRHFELKLKETNVVDPLYLLKFLDNLNSCISGKGICIWESIKTMKHFSIRGEWIWQTIGNSLVVFDDEPEELTFRCLYIGRTPFNLFKKLKIIYCGVEVDIKDPLICSCINCKSCISTPSNVGDRIEGKGDLHKSSVRHITTKVVLIATIFFTVSHSTILKIPPHIFLGKFNSLCHAKLVKVDNVVDLLRLTHIEVLEIVDGRVCCGDEIPIDVSPVITTNQVKLNSSQLTNTDKKIIPVVKRQKKLSLCRITPVALNSESTLGVERHTVDFSQLSLEEFEWVEESIPVCSKTVLLDKLPFGIQKLYLCNVNIKCSKNYHYMFSRFSSSLSKNMGTLKVLHLEGIELDLRCIPYSLELLKLEKVKIIGDIEDATSLRLGKLILINYLIKNLEQPCIQCLLDSTEKAVIQCMGDSKNNIQDVFYYEKRKGWSKRFTTKCDFVVQTKSHFNSNFKSNHWNYIYYFLLLVRLLAFITIIC